MENSKHGEVVTIYSKSHNGTGKHKIIKFAEDSKFMRIEQVAQFTGLSKASIYRGIKENRFPKQRKLGLRNIVFVRAEIEAWVESIIG